MSSKIDGVPRKLLETLIQYWPESEPQGSKTLYQVIPDEVKELRTLLSAPAGGQKERMCIHPDGCTSCSWCGFKAAPQNDESQNVARIELDGKGSTPDGSACEFRERGGEWVTDATLVYLSKYTALFVFPCGNEAVHFPHQIEFRPTRTTEQIAAAEREKARDEALNAMTADGRTSGETEEQWQFRLKIVSEMLDMGYRKP